MLHVWRDVRVRREEAGLAGRSRRQTDQRDVRDHRTARQTCRTGEKTHVHQRCKQAALRVKDWCLYNESPNLHKQSSPLSYCKEFVHDSREKWTAFVSDWNGVYDGKCDTKWLLLFYSHIDIYISQYLAFNLFAFN